MPNCPKCTSKKTVKNGGKQLPRRIHTGKPRFLCKGCGRRGRQLPI